MSNQSRLKTWIILGIILSISFILADQYVRLIEIPTLEARRDLQQSILNGTAVSPYQFRVLVPWFTHGLENFLGLFTQNDTFGSVSYTHLRAHETPEHLVCRLLLEKKHNFQMQFSNQHQQSYNNNPNITPLPPSTNY